MNRIELIKRYLDFFKSKNHKEIPNSSLIPENDPTVLFTTAGMHPLVPYLLGQKHPLGKRLVNVQRCIRTGDINEVGDENHLTFFEMLGNWSLGDYFKEEAIKMSFEFLTNILKIPLEKIAITCFKGDKNSSKDKESSQIWESLGIKKQRIAFLEKKDNWWGPAGKTGPCGPDTEIFYWKSEKKIPEKFNPKDKNWIEIWNNVLMQYNKTENEEYLPAEQKNIDTGMGVERTIAVLEDKDIYLTNCFLPIIKEIENLSHKTYNENIEIKKAMRIIADHIKASVFIISDGIIPSNTEQGYVLRRLIRRAIRYLRKLEINILNIDATSIIAKKVIELYPEYNLKEKQNFILTTLKNEEDKFQKTIDNGLKQFEKMSKDNFLDGKEAFLLYQSYGFPLEIIEELAKEKKIQIDTQKFYEEQEVHQDKSRTATHGRFKSGLSDNSQEVAKLHTATHLLHSALRRVLGEDIKQKGSNITADRLRFDFNFPRKLTSEEIKKIEEIVNQEIKKETKIIKKEMAIDEAKKQGAIGLFDNKYGSKVSVYQIGDFSKEICTGPHINNTKELGTFKILKEESSSAGVRRIKAILE